MIRPANQPCTIPCALCGGTKVSELSMKSRSGASLRTVMCDACGLVWSDPRPHDVRRYYEDEYRLSYKGAYQPKAKHILRAGRAALARLEKIRDLLTAEPMTLLDVGTGGGEFAYLLKTLGHRVHGIEPNRGYAEYSRAEYGLDIASGFIQEAVLPAGGFDVITIWHVLEHTETPGAVLAKLREHLKAHGRLVVEVPNIEATCQSPSHTFHEAHLYNFNVPTLTRLGAMTGLSAVRHQISDDGGNITMVFERTDAPVKATDGRIPGNAARIQAIVSHHTVASHYLTLHPYRRFLGRLTRSLAEGFDNTSAQSARQRLGRLYHDALASN